MPELVRVAWLDAAFSLDTVPKLESVETVGWLLEGDDAAAVSVAAERLGDGYRAVTTIPRVCVLAIVRLQEVTTRER